MNYSIKFDETGGDSFFATTNLMTLRKHEFRGWLGDQGTLILTPHLTLEDHPNESFTCTNAACYARPQFAEAIHHLRDECARLQQRVWQLEDDLTYALNETNQ
jgi:hypothetical protein